MEYVENQKYYEVHDDLGEEVINETTTRYETVDNLLRNADLTHYKLIVKELFLKSNGKKYLRTTVSLIDKDGEAVTIYHIDCVKIYHGEVVDCPYDEEIEDWRK